MIIMYIIRSNINPFHLCPSFYNGKQSVILFQYSGIVKMTLQYFVSLLLPSQLFFSDHWAKKQVYFKTVRYLV